MERLWISRTELNRIMRDSMDIVSLIDCDISLTEEDDICERGLHIYTSEYSSKQRELQRAIYTTVSSLQSKATTAMLMTMDNDDSSQTMADVIAERYHDLTAESRRVAQLLGKLDAEDALL